MNAAREKRYILLLIGGTAVLLIGLGAFGLRPILNDRTTLNRERAEVDAGLAVFRPEPGETPLRQRVADLETRQKALTAERDKLLDHTITFRRRKVERRDSAETSERRIDFKVALYDARNRLQQRAEAQGVAMPYDLGTAENVTSDEDAETLLWQLASIVRLLEKLVDQGLPQVDNIQALKPFEYPDLQSDSLRVREFPVELWFQSTFDDLVDFTRLLLDPSGFFILRRFSIEKIAQDPEVPLAVHTVYSAQYQEQRDATAVNPAPSADEGPEKTNAQIRREVRRE